MRWFTGHKIIEDQDGYVVILYLDRHLTEFAREFSEMNGYENKNLVIGVEDYIKEKIPKLKVNKVKVMLGSLIVASFSIGSPGASAATVPSQVQVSMYTVKLGDTLYLIASRFGTTVAQLKSANGLTGDAIYVGQQIKVAAGRTRTYVVKSGDTLAVIAVKYGITSEQLKAVNRLSSIMIYPGQTLYIPDADTIATVNGLPDGVFKAGSTGDGVRRIQKALNTLGYSLNEDGIYSTATRGAILDFQRQYTALADDGVYGSNTKRYLQYAILSDHVVVPNPSALLVLVNKNFSLPSDYIPDNLVVPNVPFPFKEFDPKKLMRQDAASALEALFNKAKQDGIDLYGASGYRSYDRQEAIFTSKVMNQGMDAANQFSAKPGESEHQTGLAMDVTSSSVNFLLLQSFSETREGIWLKNNSADFGFIIRYPKGKEQVTGYQYEPWHIRYVGKTAAKDIITRGITLEEYLGQR